MNWKIAQVIVIHKHVDDPNEKSYRPISLLQVISTFLKKFQASQTYHTGYAGYSNPPVWILQRELIY